jgi:hypothetical protein
MGNSAGAIEGILAVLAGGDKVLRDSGSSLNGFSPPSHGLHRGMEMNRGWIWMGKLTVQKFKVKRELCASPVTP